MMGVLGFLGAYAVSYSICRLNYSAMESFGLNRYCTYIGIGMAFALVSAAWYIVILGKHILLVYIDLLRRYNVHNKCFNRPGFCSALLFCQGSHRFKG
jgi:hypothetical protein